jgi:quinol monooxygenase YgiN
MICDQRDTRSEVLLRLEVRAVCGGGGLVVVATLRVVVPRPKRREILQTLRAVLATTEVQSECARCRLYCDAQDDRAFLLVQEWTTQSALDRYLRSDLYRTILAVLETASEPPEIRFDTLAQRAGVEVVEIARRP